MQEDVYHFQKARGGVRKHYLRLLPRALTGAAKEQHGKQKAQDKASASSSDGVHEMSKDI